MDDVSRGQRWIGAVLRAQLIDRTLKTETDVVLLNRSGEGEIGDRLGHRGIYELDRAAGEIGAAENDRGLRPFRVPAGWPTRRH